MVDEMGCHLVLTTGGTGPARRDVTPDATLAIADREMPGFGEQMRQVSLHFVPTAILSRQVGVIRKQALILNRYTCENTVHQHVAVSIFHPFQSLLNCFRLPGKVEDQRLLADHTDLPVHGIFASVPYCVQLLEGPYVETDGRVVEAFRPKSARRETLS